MILWIAANIHGGEESGADASLQLLYELADRDDCGVTDILERALIVIVPTQNPDGREIDFRRNAFAFDLNQDHLARTQPETDGKLELMRQYPPAVLTDHHEFGYYRSFFPPNDDPVYHETPEQTVRQINDLFGPAFAREFRSRDWQFFNEGYGYDLFAPAVHGHARGHGLRRRRHDDRGLRRRAARPPVRPAPHGDVVDAGHGAPRTGSGCCATCTSPTWTRSTRGVAAQLEPNRTYEPHSTAGAHGARPEGAPLLLQGRTGQASRDRRC